MIFGFKGYVLLFLIVFFLCFFFVCFFCFWCCLFFVIVVCFVGFILVFWLKVWKWSILGLKNKFLVLNGYLCCKFM